MLNIGQTGHRPYKLWGLHLCKLESPITFPYLVLRSIYLRFPVVNYAKIWTPVAWTQYSMGYSFIQG